ncbi:hypothetical protein LPJ55_004182 [Coemansia sp. RSA 990]|nr:centromere protein Scm3-domain-containing protein [Coemansia mojavensis]KAJ1740796.1 hypothetical protein LPJ68_003453 [Coemansia sp. RSA 1086]KAJ1749062.1 hypothetical protein LPJ79_004037 [Coemansia sp. RSA 1821]KAJ1871079.1 hypothetical protein LPJ55_004182 [Coemansia sp. RSA 990]KAJ2668477.1 hypothetical protein IWW42_005152 [Coemansia sp. RSA 1085]
MSELDDELDQARQQSQARFRDAFEAIFAKYGHIDDEDDIIDLETGKLIVDNGRIRNAEAISLGDLLYSPDHSSPTRQRKRHRGMSFRNTMPNSGAMSSSPELLSNGQKQSLENNNAEHQHSSDYSDDSDSNESDFIDMDFGSHSLKYAHRLQSSNVDTEDYDNGLSADYETSDSIDASLDSPLDAYFTSSVENYLERLRRQIRSPAPNNTALSSSSELSASMELFNIADGLHSSPHTMSSADLDRPSDKQMLTDYEYIPESPAHIPKTTSNVPPLPHPHHAFIYEASGDVSEEEPLESYEFRRHNMQGTFPFQPTLTLHRPPSPAVLFKPQPISPHAFFDLDICAVNPYSPEEDDDDNASIHSGEQLYAATSYGLLQKK